MKLKFGVIGDWRAKARRWADELLRQIVDQVQDPMQTIGEQISDHVRKTIIAGQLRPPLSATTIARRLDNDDRPLFDTGGYILSFEEPTVTIEKFGTTLAIVMRVAPGTDYARIGRYHEYGTSRVPARPHWRPAIQAVQSSRSFFDLARWRWFKFSFPEG